MNNVQNMVSQMLEFNSKQTLSIAGSAKKSEKSSFEMLMQDKIRNAPSNKGTQDKEPATNQVKASSDNREQPATNSNEDVSDDQRELAAALTAPVVASFMPAQIQNSAVTPEILQPVVTTVDIATPQPEQPIVQADIQGQGQLSPVIAKTLEADVKPQTTSDVTAEPKVDAQISKPEIRLNPKVLTANTKADGFESNDAQDDNNMLFMESPQKTIFHDVRAVPVKVGEVEAEPINTQADDVGMQIAKRLEGILQQGESRVSVRLAPENLGSMQVQITRGVDGSLNVVLSATTDKAMSLLERHSSGLQSALATSAQVPVRIEVQGSQEGQQAQQNMLNEDGRGHHGQQQNQRQQHAEQADTQDFMQQLRLGLIDLNAKTV